MSGPSKRFPLFSRNLSCEGSRSFRLSLPRPRLRRPRRHPISGSFMRRVHPKSVRVRHELLPVLAPVKHIIGESTGKCEANEAFTDRPQRLGQRSHTPATPSRRSGLDDGGSLFLKSSSREQSLIVPRPHQNLANKGLDTLAAVRATAIGLHRLPTRLPRSGSL